MTDVVAARAIAPTRTILICDRHPVTRRVLSEQLARSKSHLQVVSVPDAASVVDAFTAHPADVVLIGIRTGIEGGSRAVDSLLTEHPSAPVITFGTAADSTLLAESILRGAQGFMVWDVSRSSGSPAIFTQSARTIVHDPSRAPRALTELEQRVLRRMCLGHSNQEISRGLSLSEEVVKNRCRTILGKLGARDRAHAVALGLRGPSLT